MSNCLKDARKEYAYESVYIFDYCRADMINDNMFNRSVSYKTDPYYYFAKGLLNIMHHMSNTKKMSHVEIRRSLAWWPSRRLYDMLVDVSGNIKPVFGLDVGGAEITRYTSNGTILRKSRAMHNNHILARCRANRTEKAIANLVKGGNCLINACIDWAKIKS